ncbi:MAG: isocitrate lyase/phosphoenolpyruvate mutase family protein [Rhodospirillales bacterium]|nr:isocitrate lyase/phosphoenolpyruvate mutase family protein [Rhodospirillales bacterium]
MNAPPTLNQQLADERIVVAPGVFDALSVLLVERAGFSAAYLSGASIAYTRFGRPDIGLVGMSEVADTLALVTDRVDIPVIVDADTGFGNALNLIRTVRTFERAGAAAIQLEDQVSPKRCGHLAGKALVTADEMVGKVRAALDARHDASTLIIARTDAIAVEGLDAAFERAERYAEAGADMLFVEAPPSLDDMRRVTERLGSKAPLMANMVEGGHTPMASAAELEAMGFSLVIFPGGTVRALAHATRDYLASLKEHGTTAPFAERMFDFDALTGLVGTDDMLAAGKRYDGENET